jgi:hypothetical protein
MADNRRGIEKQPLCHLSGTLLLPSDKIRLANLDFTADENCELERVAGTREVATTTTGFALVVGRAVGRSFVISITRV